MMYYTHIAFGLLMLVLFGGDFNSYQTILAVSFGALLPDIDLPSSVIGRVFYPISTWINRRYGHRTITHSLFALLLFGSNALIGYTFGINIPAFIFLGYFSHLLIDMLTPMGVMLFFPNPMQFVALGGGIEVGSIKEIVLFVGILLVLSALAYLSIENVSIRLYLENLFGGGLDMEVRKYLQLDRTNFVDIFVKGYWSSSNSYVELEGTVIDGYNSLLIVYSDGYLYRISETESSINFPDIELRSDIATINEEIVIPPKVFVDYNEFLSAINENEFTLVSGRLYLAKQLSAQERFLIEEYQKDRPEAVVAVTTVGDHELRFQRAPLEFFERIERFIPGTTILSGPITVTRKSA